MPVPAWHSAWHRADFNKGTSRSFPLAPARPSRTAAVLVGHAALTQPLVEGEALEAAAGRGPQGSGCTPSPNLSWPWHCSGGPLRREEGKDWTVIRAALLEAGREGASQQPGASQGPAVWPGGRTGQVWGRPECIHSLPSSPTTCLLMRDLPPTAPSLTSLTPACLTRGPTGPCGPQRTWGFSDECSRF